MKSLGLKIMVILFCTGCITSVKKYKYNSCEFYKSHVQKDSLYDFYVQLADLKLNKLDTNISSGFYGAFKGTMGDDKVPYNFVVFNTSLTPDEFRSANMLGQVNFISVRNVDCLDFYSSFNISEFIDKKLPVIIGEFIWLRKD